MDNLRKRIPTIRAMLARTSALAAVRRLQHPNSRPGAFEGWKVWLGGGVTRNMCAMTPLVQSTVLTHWRVMLSGLTVSSSGMWWESDAVARTIYGWDRSTRVTRG